jgi:uracil-DNA glycosylase
MPSPINKPQLPKAWTNILQPAMQTASFKNLQDFITHERQHYEVYPPVDEVYTAFHLTAWESLKVVILGQDPYHNTGQAHGLSFSVQPGIKIPPSLRNIYKELAQDLAIPPAKHGHLSTWASQGILMLNTVLTVQAHQANSHRKKGWEVFTDYVIQQSSEKKEHVVFILWGKPAQSKKKFIHDRHTCIMSAHPSPLAARYGFFGSAPFSQCNHALIHHQQSPIDWSLPICV